MRVLYLLFSFLFIFLMPLPVLTCCLLLLCVFGDIRNPVTCIRSGEICHPVFCPRRTCGLPGTKCCKKP
uniref:Beta/alpha-defensin C-terminal domain-containing protein n=1 Tax=Nomascus leucogenys TaxID=61853 RepID=A0A2I3HB62_NOMLE